MKTISGTGYSGGGHMGGGGGGQGTTPLGGGGGRCTNHRQIWYLFSTQHNVRSARRGGSLCSTPAPICYNPHKFAHCLGHWLLTRDGT